MLILHPVLQIAVTFLALYVFWLGIDRFRQRHLQQKIIFKWQAHVKWGSIALVLWLIGALIGLTMTKVYWHGTFITGSHGDRLFVVVSLLLFGLLSGWYMNRQKKQRVVLPLVHAAANVVLIVFVLLQALSGWDVYREFVLGF